jgi:hypothetical protein
MFILRATQKVIKASGKLEIADANQPLETALSEWYVNRFSGGERGKFVMVFFHVPSQMVIITPDKSLKKAFANFKQNLKELLERQYFKPEFVAQNFDFDADFVVTKTNSRKILGQQNDAIKDIQYWMENYTHFDAIKWAKIEDSLYRKLIWVGKTEVSEPRKYWQDLGAIMDEDEMEKARVLKAEELMMDNAVMRLQIESRDGAHLEKSANIPPEIENMFLKRVMAFEEAAKYPKSTTIRKICGDIEFPDSLELDDMELEEEFNRAIDILENNKVTIDFLAEYDTKTKYDFIVNELLDYETEVIPLEGMVHGFIYEEFHPNAQMDIEARIEELFDFLVKDRDEENPELMWFADKIIEINGEKCDGKRVLQRFNEFVSAGIWPEAFEYEIKSIKVDDKKVNGCAEVELKDEHKKIREIEIKLKCIYDWWEVKELNV